MSEQSKTLQKLVFNVHPEPASKDDMSTRKYQFTFIYGIAPEGLCDFEIAINDLNVGDTIELSLSDINLRAYLGHLFLPFCKQTGLVDFNRSMRFTFELRETLTPPTREIVSAMAEVQTTGSCSGSCDCGCH